jgi:hypothetical protein
MELAEETWVCRRLEDEMAGDLQTDRTAQFKHTKRTNSGMLKKLLLLLSSSLSTSHTLKQLNCCSKDYGSHLTSTS